MSNFQNPTAPLTGGVASAARTLLSIRGVGGLRARPGLRPLVR